MEGDKLSRIEMLWLVKSSGYDKCGSIYYKHGLTREYIGLKNDGDVLMMLVDKGNTDIVEVFVDKVEDAKIGGAQEGKESVYDVEIMVINTLPSTHQGIVNEGVQTYLELEQETVHVDSLNSFEEDNVGLDDDKKNAEDEEGSSDSDYDNEEGDVESNADAYADNLNISDIDIDSEGDELAAEVTQVRENRANQRKDKSKRRRPEPPAEVQLGPLGVDKDVESEVHSEEREGLLGGDEDYIGSSYVDSFGSDSEDEDGLKRVKKKKFYYDPNCEEPIFEIGMIFKNVCVFRDAVSLYAVKRGAKLKQRPNDFHKVNVRCLGEGVNVNRCQWKLYGSLDMHTNNFVVKTYRPRHISSKTNKNKLCDSKFSARVFREKISDTHNIRLWQLQELVKNKLKVYVGKIICSRAKFRVMQKFMGDYKAEFSRLYDYRDELLRSNHGSTCVILTDYKDELIQSNPR
ncbi:hypothetical protein M5689_010923 [Euphorbia peplus]|nr:hypothetical protein M5689_010923 [Euphorbia peplus]